MNDLVAWFPGTRHTLGLVMGTSFFFEGFYTPTPAVIPLTWPRIGLTSRLDKETSLSFGIDPPHVMTEFHIAPKLYFLADFKVLDISLSPEEVTPESGTGSKPLAE